MARMIKIYKIEDKEILGRFKIGDMIRLGYTEESNLKFRIDKIIAYDHNVLNLKDGFEERHDFLLDINSIGTIIGTAYKFDFKFNLLKEKENHNIFWNCLVGNKNCFVHQDKIKLIP